jgi:hypothetical protein
MGQRLRSLKKRAQDMAAQVNPFYQSILNLPGFFKNAGKRYFDFTIFHDSSRHYFREFYACFILSEWSSPEEKLLSYYGLPSFLSPFSALIKIVHIGKILVLHAVLSSGYLSKTIRKDIKLCHEEN